MFYYPPWSHKTYLPAKRGTSKSPAFCSEWTHFEASPASSLFLNQFHFLLPALLMGQAGNWCQIKLSCCNNTESSSRVYCVPRYNPIQPPDSCQNSLNKTKLDSHHHPHDVVMETPGQWAVLTILSPPSCDHPPMLPEVTAESLLIFCVLAEVDRRREPPW